MGASAGSVAQAPRLRPGGYATWRPDMDVYLERHGADGVHKREMTVDKWNTTVASVHAWNDAALAAALDLALNGSSSSRSSSSPAAPNPMLPPKPPRPSWPLHANW